ncbi:MAG: L,D-transpeptidase family protein [Propionibacteriaceae bacterium]|nr:L,D-transpeptidase family protein [Propionibacteriaceae bacterium]
MAKTSGTRAVVTMVERRPGTACGIRRVFRDTSGRIGYGGAVPASKRRQDTGTTPQGTFTITEAFGLKANPGTKLPYRVPGSGSYWVLDSRSAFYNQWREASSGGFRTRASERLRSYPGQYDYVAVINYNRWPAVKGKGGAIFLHVHGRGATAGCVSVTEANMKNFLRHASKGDTITIN